MFRHVHVNTVRTTVKKFLFMLRKDFQQRYIFTRKNHKTDHVATFHWKISENVRRPSRFQYVPMRSIVTSKLCHITTALKKQTFLFKPSLSSVACYTTNRSKPSVIMASPCFKGRVDHYNGVTVDSKEESCTAEDFAQRLTVSLQQWIKEEKRTVWFRVHLSDSEWIPVLVHEGFKFHHARQEYVTLYRWIVTHEECNVPHYAHTNLGVGAFVYDERSNKLLTIKEKYANKSAMWKLPGGYVEPGEDLETAVRREVLEETGIQTTFKCIIGFRHAHDHAFGCSDIYVIVYLSPTSFDIKKCNREISECQWMEINEYMEHSEVYETNKMVAKKMMEFFEHRMGLGVESGVHPVIKKPICIYTISKIDDTQLSLQ